MFTLIPTVLLDGSERVAKPLGYFRLLETATLSESDFSDLIGSAEIHTITENYFAGSQSPTSALISCVWGGKAVSAYCSSAVTQSALLGALTVVGKPTKQTGFAKRAVISTKYLGKKYSIVVFIPDGMSTPALRKAAAVGLGLALTAEITFSVREYTDHGSAPIGNDWGGVQVSMWNDNSKDTLGIWSDPATRDLAGFFTDHLAKFDAGDGTAPTHYQQV